METALQPPASPQGRTQAAASRRIAPLATGAALAGAALYVARNDPGAAGSRFPGCLFRESTGLWCPGCGLTRGMHSLFTGDVSAAVSTNLFTPLVAVLLVAGWWMWTRQAWGSTRPSALARVPLSWWVAGGVAVVAFGVLRNIPAAPFRALAP